MAVMDNGSIEIGNINTQASTGAIRKLKSILDQHGIFHIIDGVIFYDSHKKAARTQKNHRGRVGEVNNLQDDFQNKFQELIVPDLYELDFMSLIDFDSEEADFLSTLIYGEAVNTVKGF